MQLRIYWRISRTCISVGLALAVLSVFFSATAQNAEHRAPCKCDEVNLRDFDKNPDVPDIVERWAPVIFQDTDADNEWADLITSVNFDGNWKGSDNAARAEANGKLLRAVVYYSIVRTVTHTFLGYYFYHSYNSGNGEHEHDFEGIVAAVSRSTGQIEALLTNVHGPYVPYVAPWDPLRIQITRQHQGPFRDLSDFTLLRRYPQSTGLSYSYDALAVGIEANTHAVWGRWHNKCVIGPAGIYGVHFGIGGLVECTDHGGDGVVYVYTNKAEVPAVFGQFPHWKEYGYELRDLKELWHKAQDPGYCGQNEETALFACEHQRRMPSDTLNARKGDAGDLPWVWGIDQVIDHVCEGYPQPLMPNILLDPAEIFQSWFKFPPKTFSTVYVDRPYVMSTPCQ